MRSLRAILILIHVLGLLSIKANCQVRHYWSQTGGISASLLGGAAVAGLKDNSALYYNTAAMSFVNNPSIAIGANTYRFKTLKVDNAFGQDLNQSNSGFVVNPDLIGGLLFSKIDDRLRFGYALSTRFISDNSFAEQFSGKLENGDFRIGDFDGYLKTQETWAKSTVSYKSSDHLYFGFGLVVAIRSQTFASAIASKTLPESTDESVSRFDSRVNYYYWNVKVLFKTSLALNYEKFRFGWTASLPSLNLFGSASVIREFTLLNNTQADNLPQDIVVSGMSEKLSTTHKYPFTTSIGASFKMRNGNWIHFSSELFLPISKYSVFSSSDDIITYPDDISNNARAKSITDVNFLEYSESAKLVCNFAVGYETHITEDFGILIGLRTDFSFNEVSGFKSGEIRPYYSSWDIYYVSGGVWKIINDQKVTAGMEFGFTPKTKINQLIDFNEIDSPDYSASGASENKAVAHQLIFRLYLGIEMNFLK